MYVQSLSRHIRTHVFVYGQFVLASVLEIAVFIFVLVAYCISLSMILCGVNLCTVVIQCKFHVQISLVNFEILFWSILNDCGEKHNYYPLTLIFLSVTWRFKAMRMSASCRERDSLTNYPLEKELHCDVDKWKSIDFWKYYFTSTPRFNNTSKHEH